MQCFILAGGFATRLWPLTEKRAKPLLPLAGEPLLTRIVRGIPKDIPVTVSTNAAFGAAMKEWRNTIDHPSVTVITEETLSEQEKLGALGAVAQWITQHHIDDDVLLLTGDNVFGFPMETFLAATAPDIPLIAAHDIGDLGKASAFGTVLVDANGTTVVGFEEKPRQPKSSLVSTGCSIIPRGALPVLLDHAQRHPDNVGGIFERLLKEQWAMRCFRFTEPWFDIGSFEAYLDATRALVGNNILLGDEASCNGGKTQGSIVIGDRSHVRNAHLHDTVLFNDCIVDDCVLRDCIVDEHCVLQGVDITGQMLRAGTHLIRTDK